MVKSMNRKFIKKYIDTPSPTGFEMELGGQKVWMKQAEKYAKVVETDNYGTAYAITGNLDSKYTVIMDAHCDEISWLVSKISKDGFISVVRNGGSDAQIAPSMRVNLWGKNGKVEGIFGHPAIHIHDRPDKVELKNLFIDIGASNDKEVLELGIEIGTVATFQDGYMELGKNFIVGRSLDDKIGGCITLSVLKAIKDNNIELPFKLVAINSVQEEIGLKGAEMAANRLKPDVAFIIDVCHEDSSPAYKDKEHKAGDGCIFAVAPAVHNNLLKYVKDIANKNEIKYKLEAHSRVTGTNTDSYAYPNGCPSMLISLPLRYMHTTVETVHKNDIQSTTDVLYQSIINLKENQSFKY
jgi:putative aminopeptidase FrvX